MSASAIRSWSEIDVRAEKYYEKIIALCKRSMKIGDNIAFILVDHCLQTFQTHVDSLGKLGRVAGVILKSSTRVAEAEAYAATSCKTLIAVTKEQLMDAKTAIDVVLKNTKPHEKVVIMDHGGYFAPALKEMMAHEELGKRLIGIAEVTENGHVKLEKALQKTAVPNLSVARTLIKELEDAQTGVAICDATNRILNDVHSTLNSLHNACIIGYGKIGRSIALSCRKRGIPEVTVIEINPLRAQLAMIEGNHVVMGDDVEAKTSALQKAQVLFSATGSKVLSHKDVANLRKVDQPNPVLYIASCTSPDDEFDPSFFKELEALSKNSKEDRKACEAKLHLSPYELFDGRKIYILNEGKSVNFVIGGTPGFEICQVWAGVLYTAAKLAAQAVLPSQTVQALTYPEEMAICRTTQSTFFPSASSESKADAPRGPVSPPPLRRSCSLPSVGCSPLWAPVSSGSSSSSSRMPTTENKETKEPCSSSSTTLK